MKVIKFGGTSIGSASSILKVKAIIEGIDKPVVVVVSALGGVTDQLLNTSKLAAQRDYTYEKEYNNLVGRHIELVEQLIHNEAQKKEALKRIMELLNELGNIF